jgi:hypothetical protein
VLILVGQDCPSPGDPDYCPEAKAMGAAMAITGLAAGFVTGLIVGAARGHRHTYRRAPGWEPVIRPRGAPGSVGATAAWSF